MNAFRRVVTYIWLVLSAAVLAAVFGALHDQLSYTVSAEYFTRFKFIQFAFWGVDTMPPRLGAAVVGIIATWWVGLLAGIIVAAAGFRHRHPTAMRRATWRAYRVLASCAVAAGLAGLVLGWLVFGPNEHAPYVDWWRPAGLVSPRRFYAVGMMHNGSYLGGVVGTVAALVSQWQSARALARVPESIPPAPVA